MRLLQELADAYRDDGHEAGWSRTLEDLAALGSAPSQVPVQLWLSVEALACQLLGVRNGGCCLGAGSFTSVLFGPLRVGVGLDQRDGPAKGRLVLGSHAGVVWIDVAGVKSGC
jgi:hypothetical protein